jgi:hypothetical protein
MEFDSSVGYSHQFPASSTIRSIREATTKGNKKKNVFLIPKKSYLANQAEKEYFSDRYLAEN